MAGVRPWLTFKCFTCWVRNPADNSRSGPELADGSGGRLALYAPKHSSDKSYHAAGGSVKRERDETRYRHQAATDNAQVTRHKRAAALAVILELAVRVVRRGATRRPPFRGSNSDCAPWRLLRLLKITGPRSMCA